MKPQKSRTWGTYRSCYELIDYFCEFIARAVSCQFGCDCGSSIIGHVGVLAENIKIVLSVRPSAPLCLSLSLSFAVFLSARGNESYLNGFS
jgi:hypothetical protein